MELIEPTNFLDLLGVIWLENYFTSIRGRNGKTVVIVSHDRDFLNMACEEIIVLRDQSLSYFKGNLSAYEEDVKAQKLYWGANERSARPSDRAHGSDHQRQY